MRSHRPDLLLVYCKISEGEPLTKEEQDLWNEFEKQDEYQQILGSGEWIEKALADYARIRQDMLPFEDFLEKHRGSTINLPWQELKPVEEVRRSKWKYGYLVLAAVLILKMGTIWWLISSNSAHDKAALPADWNRLEIPRGGGAHQLQLADGTRIWLNAASVLRYPAADGKVFRQVVLEEGEAWFEVARKPAAQPFMVHCKDQKIQVLGTKFNVRAYNNEGTVTTTLVEGAVRITYASEQWRLRPGQQAVVDKHGNLSVSSMANLKDVTAWKNNYFVFRDKKLSEIMAEVGRWYNLEEVYLDPIGDERFVIDEYARSEPLAGLLKHLEATRMVRFEVKGKKIYVRRR